MLSAKIQTETNFLPSWATNLLSSQNCRHFSNRCDSLTKSLARRTLPNAHPETRFSATGRNQALKVHRKSPEKPGMAPELMDEAAPPTHSQTLGTGQERGAMGERSLWTSLLDLPSPDLSPTQVCFAQQAKTWRHRVLQQRGLDGKAAKQGNWRTNLKSAPEKTEAWHIWHNEQRIWDHRQHHQRGEQRLGEGAAIMVIFLRRPN